MADLIAKKIRARVTSAFGIIETPYIQSFYVARVRNQLDSCSCSLKVSKENTSTSVSTIEIEAGTANNMKKVFSGYIVSVNVRPCFEDPSFSYVDIQATDARKFLEGRTFVRRQKKAKECWVEITGVTRSKLKSSNLKYTRRTEFNDSVFPAPADQSSAEPSTAFIDTTDILNKASLKSQGTNSNRRPENVFTTTIENIEG